MSNTGQVIKIEWESRADLMSSSSSCLPFVIWCVSCPKRMLLQTVTTQMMTKAFNSVQYLYCRQALQNKTTTSTVASYWQLCCSVILSLVFVPCPVLYIAAPINVIIVIMAVIWLLHFRALNIVSPQAKGPLAFFIYSSKINSITSFQLTSIISKRNLLFLIYFNLTLKLNPNKLQYIC